MLEHKETIDMIISLEPNILHNVLNNLCIPYGVFKLDFERNYNQFLWKMGDSEYVADDRNSERGSLDL